MAKEICCRFIVSGRVQGVFFRASTASMADRLGLRGRASNMRDGKVLVIAIGPPAAVEALWQWLHEGPPSAQVSEVQRFVEELDSWRHLPDFRTG